MITISADSNKTAIGLISEFNNTDKTVLGYTIMTHSISGSWNVQLSYIDIYHTVIFTNFGSTSNEWTGLVRMYYI